MAVPAPPFATLTLGSSSGVLRMSEELEIDDRGSGQKPASKS